MIAFCSSLHLLTQPYTVEGSRPGHPQILQSMLMQNVVDLMASAADAYVAHFLL